MDSGYYAACAGLRARAQALDLMASNLANSQTSGYRAQSAVFQSLLAAQAPAASGAGLAPLNRGVNAAVNAAVNEFGVLGNSVLDLAPGNFEHTGGNLDLAVEGPGFFAVQAGTGVLYTRNGAFRISTQGRLVTADGNAVLGDQGPLQLPSGDVAIGPDGTVSVNGASAGKLRVAEFAPGTALRAEGGSYYSAPVGSARSGTASAVRQGTLEGSNVNAVSAAVALITVQREAEMLQRVLSLFHSEFQRIAAQDLPKV
jgi:flagellar basal-body rod protein FlgF/flagellar basal-body rod protein FlgG